jgi:hypothetical protein
MAISFEQPAKFSLFEKSTQAAPLHAGEVHHPQQRAAVTERTHLPVDRHRLIHLGKAVVEHSLPVHSLAAHLAPLFAQYRTVHPDDRLHDMVVDYLHQIGARGKVSDHDYQLLIKQLVHDSTDTVAPAEPAPLPTYPEAPPQPPSVAVASMFPSNQAEKLHQERSERQRTLQKVFMEGRSLLSQAQVKGIRPESPEVLTELVGVFQKYRELNGAALGYNLREAAITFTQGINQVPSGGAGSRPGFYAFFSPVQEKYVIDRLALAAAQ